MENIKNNLKKSIELKSEILHDEELLNRVKTAAELICVALQNGNKVMLCGNGGSATDAMHLSSEFLGKFCKDRRALPAICLNANISVMTAIANDFGYEKVFLRQVQGLGQCGDVLIGFSTSGNSKNIVEAFKYASSVDIKCVAFTGATGGELAEYADLLINLPSQDTPRIQEAHITLGHIICELVEAKFL